MPISVFRYASSIAYSAAIVAVLLSLSCSGGGGGGVSGLIAPTCEGKCQQLVDCDGEEFADDEEFDGCAQECEDELAGQKVDLSPLCYRTLVRLENCVSMLSCDDIEDSDTACAGELEQFETCDEGETDENSTDNTTTENSADNSSENSTDNSSENSTDNSTTNGSNNSTTNNSNNSTTNGSNNNTNNSTTNNSNNSTTNSTDNAANNDTDVIEPGFCFDSCAGDLECDIGYDCIDDACVYREDEVPPCTDDGYCAAYRSGWTHTETGDVATCDQNSDCDDLFGRQCAIYEGQGYCIEQGNGNCFDGYELLDLPLADGGGTIAICTITSTQCHADGHCTRCNSDDDCSDWADYGQGTCLDTGRCGCGSDSDCDTTTGDTCFDGTCGCSDEEACHVNQVCVDP